MKLNPKKKSVVFFLLTTLPWVLCFVIFLKLIQLEQQIGRLQNQLLEYVSAPTDTEGKEEIQKKEEPTKAPQPVSQDVYNADGFGGIIDGKEEEPQFDVSSIKGKVAYLTFDDGPSDNTGKILDILKEYDVRATFFVVGQTDNKSVRLYKRIVKEGHTLGMHSFSHDYSKVYASEDAFEEDLKKIQTFLYRVTGVKSTYYRFPGGSSNSVSSVPVENLIRILNENHVMYYDWNAANGDALGTILPANQLIANSVNSILKNDESIVLMHDGNMYDTTVESLPDVLKLLKDNEVTMLPINEETSPVHHVALP